eukprot:CAMPEP_0172506260 /NCGR_PEP_ID=MMETSP1066-20121228/193270_1 /TAXON_ID=671091 /ORGANISM="Coscinodiscus wailesii, Strain CCMP2513" /LENGTH=282 /DNA_ID=CAMNT_0013283205 /DNA_START=152 /DNA_END=997 /DNA_ORIENTATION=+
MIRRNRANINGKPSPSSHVHTIIHNGGARATSSLHMIPPSPIFDNTLLWQSTSAIGAINALGFLVSLATGSHLHLDLLGTGAFAVSAALPLITKGASLTPRVTLSCAAVCLWGVKLAGFLFFRALKLGHDARLDETLSTVGGTAAFWTISAVWGLVCSLPHALGTTSSLPGNDVAVGVGTAAFVVGFLTETCADYQKWNFKQSGPPGAFCNVGLWSVSQHPNFLGNFVLWTGIFVMNASALIEPVGAGVGLLGRIWSWRRVGLALLSPLFMWTLFSGQANGT